ncbi:SDR family oxidoreductase [Echinicola vietnamensis]|uniref:Putative nucleoside-diphosphate sugar epimerase n=1 Tax=Echinicola vietnamensis (strain DSM 17526 / LMG 23754 / KMM 6221) TaxID=926556 RepID=L0G117_ECHVK|nr:SDR family oxidoreductase [Echinicola vietnamensis]AGA79904.1 putative nucleoside-diphosphate sugar epimerase [Echinicola vietnamensis DSM 17526]
MKILLTGATGYIGKRLLPSLVRMGHEVVCCVRDKNRFEPPPSLRKNIQVVEVDFLKESSLSHIPKDIQAAYYLIHSMSSADDFSEMEKKSAQNFRKSLQGSEVKHVLYLGGIINNEMLSKHLQSRKVVEEELAKGHYHFTALRAGIIIGSGSASFEIIRDLVEKLPVMIAPRWLKTRCQPIAIRDVISFLSLSLGEPKAHDRAFDIGGPDILSYKEMLLGYAKNRGLARSIWTVPVMTPRLSSYWLFFVTSTSYKLAVALVDSMKVEVICQPNHLAETLGIKPMNYQQALSAAFTKIESNEVISSWKDSLISGRFENNLSEYIQIPTHGCFVDSRSVPVSHESDTLDRIFAIGGDTGWYYGNWLWKLRGFMDKLAGGVGLRRGRTHPTTINSGDAVDFWRVLYAKKAEKRLLLYAEMKVPGDAWLEFKIENGCLVQTATFRPKGLWGRVYWYAVYPFHGPIFGGMVRKLAG